MEVKKIISNAITLKIDNINYEELITPVQEGLEGDYCIPCFTFAKALRKSPLEIATIIKDSVKDNTYIEKMEVVGGYLNFYLRNNVLIENVLKEAKTSTCFFEDKEYDKKIICIDYSSVNLAKYMHIGHLSTTMIGESLARIYEAKGYKAVRINYIGDYGTPFGKMMHAHLSWGNDKELEKRGVDYLQELYVEFCKRAEEDEVYEQKAREYFKKIEEKDEHIYPIYQKFINVSKLETKEILDKLDVHFDSWKGESAYTNKLDEVVEELQIKNIVVTSEGAQVVDLNPYNLGICLIQKSDGTSLYATRDIAAAKDRYNEYKFDKMLYVTAVQQKLHFEQFFKVLELMGYEFSKDLFHIYYGMFSLPDGKIASRKGKQAILKDLMEYSYNKAYAIVQDREFKIENKESVANKIAMSTLKFNALKKERIKDAVFDIDNSFSFDGDTSTYLQYTYARIASILRKVEIKSIEEVNYSYLNKEDIYKFVLSLNRYKETLNQAMLKNEPSILSKYAFDICKLFNKIYTSEKIICDNFEETRAKVFLLTTIKQTLTNLYKLICVDTIEEM
jgi:arginyl-tRNA synthetase